MEKVAPVGSPGEEPENRRSRCLLGLPGVPFLMVSDVLFLTKCLVFLGDGLVAGTYHAPMLAKKMFISADMTGADAGCSGDCDGNIEKAS